MTMRNRDRDLLNTSEQTGLQEFNKMIIKSKEDLKKHFDWHDKIRDEMMELKSNYLDNHNLNNRQESEEYDKLDLIYQKRDVEYSEFDISFDKIVMYVGHEGSVLGNIQFCPFCGVEFNLQLTEKN